MEMLYFFITKKCYNFTSKKKKKKVLELKRNNKLVLTSYQETTSIESLKGLHKLKTTDASRSKTTQSNKL